MGSIGFSEILLIFLVILLLFGAKKLPEVARGMGQALREFRKAAKEVEEVATIPDEDPTLETHTTLEKSQEEDTVEAKP